MNAVPLSHARVVVPTLPKKFSAQNWIHKFMHHKYLRSSLTLEFGLYLNCILFSSNHLVALSSTAKHSISMLKCSSLEINCEVSQFVAWHNRPSSIGTPSFLLAACRSLKLIICHVQRLRELGRLNKASAWEVYSQDSLATFRALKLDQFCQTQRFVVGGNLEIRRSKVSSLGWCYFKSSACYLLSCQTHQLC